MWPLQSQAHHIHGRSCPGTDGQGLTPECKRPGDIDTLSVRLKAAASVQVQKTCSRGTETFFNKFQPKYLKIFISDNNKKQEHSLQRVLRESYETSSSTAPCREILLFYGRFLSSFDLPLRQFFFMFHLQKHKIIKRKTTNWKTNIGVLVRHLNMIKRFFLFCTICNCLQLHLLQKQSSQQEKKCPALHYLALKFPFLREKKSS